ncbi:MAG: hypothetical protein H0V88_03790 [Pyrinomonadaceae bacterium]|nr:hypothetical protein [Pyrinomonadaceae bacterium]
MNKLSLIVAALSRDKVRWASGQLYYLLVLAPLVLGLSYLTASRVASNAPIAAKPSSLLALTLTALVESCLILSGVSRSATEIYNVRLAENYFNSLPVNLGTHLFTAFIKRLARVALVLGFVFLALRSLVTSAADLNLIFLFWLALLIFLTASAQMFAALCWVHSHRTQSKLALLLGAVMLLMPAAALGGALMLNLVSFPFSFPHGQLYLLAGAATEFFALLFITSVLHSRWRIFDLEHAAMLQSSRIANFASLATKRLWGGSVRTQLARDLQLTLRFFSARVYLALWLAALWAISLFVLLVTTDLLPRAGVARSIFELTWSPSIVATKVVAVLTTATLAALLPLLVAYELPYLWLERAVGVTGKQLWQAKCWYARIVSLPAPLIAWAAGASTNALPANYIVPALLECLWLWWLVSTLIGALAFEMPTKPGLALVVMLTFAVAVGLFVSLLWPVGLLLYVFGISQIAGRGEARAKYFLLTGED